MSVVALWSPLDAILGVVAPLGAAAAVDTALVIDLDPHGPRYGGPFSLADLVSKGPKLDQLEPQRRGPAVLRNGGVQPEDAEEIVSELVTRWPNIVLRCPQQSQASQNTIALLPLLPEPFTPSVDGLAIYQRTHLSASAPGREVVLPVPRTSTIKSLLGGVSPPRRDRWVRALGQIWSI